MKITEAMRILGRLTLADFRDGACPVDEMGGLRTRAPHPSCGGTELFCGVCGNTFLPRHFQADRNFPVVLESLGSEIREMRRDFFGF